MDVRTVRILTSPGRHYALYQHVFADVNEEAAQRHLMKRYEFDALCRDALITKWIGYDYPYGGEPVAIGMSTPRLDRVSLISEPFYRRKYGDELVDAGRVWYVLFIGVSPGRRGGYQAMLKAMAEPIAAVQGVACLDMCAYNFEEPPRGGRGLDRATTGILLHAYPDLSHRIDDVQTFLSYDFQDVDLNGGDDRG